nr:hypothetical protein CFP56_70968 [Quercus suber]
MARTGVPHCYELTAIWIRQQLLRTSVDTRGTTTAAPAATAVISTTRNCDDGSDEELIPQSGECQASIGRSHQVDARLLWGPMLTCMYCLTTVPRVSYVPHYASLTRGTL